MSFAASSPFFGTGMYLCIWQLKNSSCRSMNFISFLSYRAFLFSPTCLSCFKLADLFYLIWNCSECKMHKDKAQKEGVCSGREGQSLSCPKATAEATQTSRRPKCTSFPPPTRPNERGDTGACILTPSPPSPNANSNVHAVSVPTSAPDPGSGVFLTPGFGI